MNYFISIVAIILLLGFFLLHSEERLHVFKNISIFLITILIGTTLIFQEVLGKIAIEKGYVSNILTKEELQNFAEIKFNAIAVHSWYGGNFQPAIFIVLQKDKKQTKISLNAQTGEVIEAEGLKGSNLKFLAFKKQELAKLAEQQRILDEQIKLDKRIAKQKVLEEKRQQELAKLDEQQKILNEQIKKDKALADKKPLEDKKQREVASQQQKEAVARQKTADDQKRAYAKKQAEEVARKKSLDEQQRILDEQKRLAEQRRLLDQQYVKAEKAKKAAAQRAREKALADAQRRAQSRSRAS